MLRLCRLHTYHCSSFLRRCFDSCGTQLFPCVQDDHTRQTTCSSSRRRFSSNLLSHRNVLTTKKLLGAEDVERSCDPFSSSHPSKYTSSRPLNLDPAEAPTPQLPLSISHSRSGTAPPWQLPFCRVPSADARLHILVHKRQIPRRSLRRRLRALLWRGRHTPSGCRRCFHRRSIKNSCPLDFPQKKTLHVFWREKESAAQQLHDQT